MSKALHHRRLLAAISVVAGLAAAGPASAQEGTARTVSAYGQGSIAPTPHNPNSNDSIVAAVKEAAALAIPAAIADAQKNAAELAAGAGVTLGEMLAIANVAPSPFYGPFFGQDGTFGPGKYCGTIVTSRLVKGKDGKRHRVIRRHHGCRIPPQVVRQVEVTYAVAQ